MNKAFKTISLAFIGVQCFIFLFELGTCILNEIISKINCGISNSILTEENNVKILTNLRRNQIYRCIYLLLKSLLSIFFIVFVDSLDLFFKKKTVSENIEISYGDEIITLDKESNVKEQEKNKIQLEDYTAEQENNDAQSEKYINDQEINDAQPEKHTAEQDNNNEQSEDIIAEQENNDVEKDKIEKSNFIFKTMIKFSGSIISLFQSEDSILLWISHLYIYTMYINYLFDIKTAWVVLIFPYFYKKLNLNFYLRYRYNKPLVFTVFIVLFKLIFSFISHLTKKLRFIKKSELPTEIQKYFKITKKYVLTTCESSDKFNLDFYSIFKFVYLHFTGDIDKLTTDEQIALFERQIRNDKNRFKKLIINFLSLIVSIASQVLFIRYGRGLFTKNFTKIGEYFVGYMVLNCGIFIILNFICNYFYHKIEYNTDFNTTNIKINEDLVSALCKQAVLNDEYISYTRLFNIFYDQAPSFINRCKRLMSNT